MYWKSRKKTLNLKNRKKYKDDGLDYIFIEILEEDNIKEFLNIDENLVQSDNLIEELKKNNSIYVFNSMKQFSPWSIRDFSNGYITYNSETEPGWSGSPIFNNNNNNVIAIHKGFDKEKNLNTGLLIRSVIKNMKNEPDTSTEAIITENEK